MSTMRRLLTAEVGMRLLVSLKDEGERTWGGRWSLDRLDPQCTAEWDGISLCVFVFSFFCSRWRLFVDRIMTLRLIELALGN